MKRLSAVVLGTSVLFPVAAFAQELGNIENLIEAIGRLVRLATPIIIGLALLAFFWGLVTFIFSEEKKKEGKSLMIGGIIAIFVMVSIVGIVSFIGSSLGIDQGGNLPVPGVRS